MANAEKIKHLRDTTGLSFNQIKKALDEAGEDTAKAMEILKTQGIATAQKKASREAKEGVIDAYLHATKKLGVIIEVFCETDFVARNSEFQKLVHDLAMHIAAAKPGTVNELLDQPFIKDEDIIIKDLISQYVAKLGENIKVGRFEIFEI